MWALQHQVAAGKSFLWTAFREIAANKAVTIALQRHDNTALGAG
jgi:hypothetical protein